MTVGRPTSTSTSRVHQPSTLITAITSSSGQFTILDFGEIEKSKAEKLIDDDVAAILSSIKGVQYLKTLKLTGCVNISGRCLQSLLGSSVVEQIDLSLVGQHENPVLDPPPSLSLKGVLPIVSVYMEYGLPRYFYVLGTR